MALAVVFGQQAVAMHDLAHATGHKQESTPGKSTCDKCFACAELSSAVGATIPPVALPQLAAVLAHEVETASAPSATLLAYRSQAPPVRS
jgi:hypothetical protein